MLLLTCHVVPGLEQRQQHPASPCSTKTAFGISDAGVIHGTPKSKASVRLQSDDIQKRGSKAKVSITATSPEIRINMHPSVPSVRCLSAYQFTEPETKSFHI